MMFNLKLYRKTSGEAPAVHHCLGVDGLGTAPKADDMGDSDLFGFQGSENERNLSSRIPPKIAEPAGKVRGFIRFGFERVITIQKSLDKDMEEGSEILSKGVRGWALKLEHETLHGSSLLKTANTKP